MQQAEVINDGEDDILEEDEEDEESVLDQCLPQRESGSKCHLLWVPL